MLSDRIFVNEKYKSYYHQITELPENLVENGETIYVRRNLTKKISITNTRGETIEVAVKAYSIPNRIRGLIYGNFKTPRARSSMIKANLLLEKGFLTPNPIACIVFLKLNCLHKSYYISQFWDNNFDLESILYEKNGVREWNHHYLLLEKLARFSAKLHNKGILHLDYTPSNILVRSTGTNFDFALVDFDQLKFRNPTNKDRIKGLVRLTSSLEIMRFIGYHYANFLSIDPNEFCQILEARHQRIWSENNPNK